MLEKKLGLDLLAMPDSRFASTSECHRSTLSLHLFLLIIVLLETFFRSAQALQSASRLDATSKHSRLSRILGMTPSFVCSSAFAPHLFRQKQHLRHCTSSKTSTAKSIPKPSMSNNEVQSSKATWKQSRIACVGDIHGQWDDIDESALRNLNPDLALFVGDYGDEAVNITRRIAAFAEKVSFDVATVFGNHDAFFTQPANGRRRAPYNKAKTCRVTEQMELLAPYDVSYRSKSFHNIGASVCGGRSFSVGGPNWKYSDFYQKFIGVYSLSHSTSKMLDAVSSSEYERIIFLSHSGPVGLGGKPSDPCGKDWGKNPEGDYGDKDLRDSIEAAREQGFRVPLTVFGHMHKQLMHGQGNRTMLKTEPDGETGYSTVMLNAAVCPRHKIGSKSNHGLRHFQLVELGETGYVSEVQEIWVSASGQIAESTLLFSADMESEAPMNKEDQVIIEKAYPRRHMRAT